MSKLEAEFNGEDVEILERRDDHRGFLRIETLELKHRRHEGGWIGPMQREVLVKDPAVGVLLFDPQRDEVVLVRQFRVGVLNEKKSPWLLELVAGMVDKGESPEQVACRECLEEADLEPQDLIKIADYYNSPGTSNERVILYCGRIDAANAGGYHGLDHEHEDIEVISLSVAEAEAAVADGIIDNAMSVIAIQWLMLHKAEICQRWQAS